MFDLLFVLKVPPPVHGSTMMNKIIADSSAIGKGRRATYHLQSISKSVDDIGRFSLIKLYNIILNYSNLLIDLLKYRPRIVYFAISPKGIAFYKDLISVLIIKLFDSSIIYHFHVKGIELEMKNSKYKKFWYNYIFDGEYAIVLSDTLKNEYESFKFNRIFIVPNGIKNENDVAINHSNNESFVITYLSNFIKEKGVLEYIEALKLLNDSGANFRYNIIGKSSDINIEMIKKKIEDYNLSDKLNHLGAAYGNEKNSLLSNSSLFIFPTYYKNECYPLVLLEAMQFGLPIITSNEGAISDIVRDGENGFIIDPHSPTEIAEKAELLIDNKRLHKKFSSNSYVLFKENNTLVKFENNINEVLDSVFKIQDSE